MIGVCLFLCILLIVCMYVSMCMWATCFFEQELEELKAEVDFLISSVEKGQHNLSLTQDRVLQLETEVSGVHYSPIYIHVLHTYMLVGGGGE